MTARPDPRVGSDLGPYRIEALIGRGGMGVVYLATDMRLDRRVAIKLLTADLADDEAFRARFLRESRLAASIDHPNIIPVYEAGELEGTYYLVMRYVEGTDLDARLRAGPLEPGEAVHLLAQVASALDAANDAGMVHRDVKPANILIAPGKALERGDHAYLTDFGLTKHRGSETNVTRAGSFIGTLDYIAPEQIEGKTIDGRADQYALACMTFQVLTGAPPFVRDNDAAVLMAHLRDAPPQPTALRADLPTAVDAVLARGMAKRPEDRYPSNEAFVSALRQALGVRPTEEHQAMADGERRTRRLVAGIAAVALVVVVAVAVGAWGLGGAAGPSPSATNPTAIVATLIPSAVPTPSADPSLFPNAKEQVLLALLPAALANTCRRGNGKSDTTAAGFRGQIIVSRSGIPPKPDYGPVQPRLPPTASLRCTPPGGPDEVFIQALGDDPIYSDSGEEAAAAVSTLVTRYLIPRGDCSSGRSASTTWSMGGSARPSGNVACIPKADWDGAAWIDWSFAGGTVLGLATRRDADYGTLYAWWKQLVLFLR